MHLSSHNKAFTMLELVMVIVILGIVSSISSTIIAQLYENYIIQRAFHRVSSKTELAANQIAARLAYRINSSVVVRHGSTILPLAKVGYGDSNTSTVQILEWIGYDNDSFTAKARPGWSGYCDTKATHDFSSKKKISTPGSHLSTTDAIIKSLSDNTKDISNAAVLFSVAGEHTSGVPNSQEAECYGYTGDKSCIHTVNAIDTNSRFITDAMIATGTNISRHYKLAWTAYSLVPIAPADGTPIAENYFDLELRYNYQPWDNIQYNHATTEKSTLIRGVTSFKYSEQGGTLRFKLCATEKIGDDSTVNISVCKEKVVIR